MFDINEFRWKKDWWKDFELLYQGPRDGEDYEFYNDMMEQFYDMRGEIFLEIEMDDDMSNKHNRK